MNTIFPLIWNEALIRPIKNLLVLFYKFSESLGLPGPLGFAIILLTIAIRLLIWPLMHQQMKSAKKMSDLKPHLDTLNAKHKDDKKALQQAQLDLYKEHGVNPAAGCLPTLLQFPILIALYNVFNETFGADLVRYVTELNEKVIYFPWMKLTTLDLNFLGINLGIKPGEWQKYGWWLLAIPLITGGLQFVQSRLMMPKSSKTDEKALAVAGEKVEKKEDMAADMQKQMMIIAPIMFGFFSFQLPIGLALYWNVFGLFGIIQQLKINKSK